MPAEEADGNSSDVYSAINSWFHLINARGILANVEDLELRDQTVQKVNTAIRPI